MLRTKHRRSLESIIMIKDFLHYLLIYNTGLYNINKIAVVMLLTKTELFETYGQAITHKIK